MEFSMKNVLIVSTDPEDPLDKIKEYVHAGELPDWNWHALVECFGAEEMPPETKTFTPVADLLSPDTCEEAIGRVLAKSRFDSVVHWDEFAVITAAKLRERLGLPKAVLEQAVATRDKVLMKQRVEAVVRTPRIFERHELREQNLPLIAKPRASAGGEGVRIVNTPDELRETLASAKFGNSSLLELDLDDLEFEQFIDAPIYHLDGWVDGNSHQIVAVSQYTQPPLKVWTQTTIGSATIMDELEMTMWRHFTARVVNAMQMPDGCFHLEAFWDGEGEPVFLEIGARPGGGYIVPAVKMGLGVDLMLVHIRLLTGLRPGVSGRLASRAIGFLLFPRVFHGATAGALIHHRHRKVGKAWLDDAQELTSLKWMSFPGPGYSIEGPLSFEENLGGFILCADNRDKVLADMESIENAYHIETEDGHRVF
jgi:hypothetical protein